MKDMSPRARDLFARARASGAPSPADRARLLDRVQKATAPSVPPPPAPPTIGLPAIGVGGLIVMASLLAVLGTGGADPVATGGDVSVATPEVEVEVEVEAEREVEREVEVEVEVEAEAEAEREPASPRRAPIEDDMTLELRLLRRAQSARRAHRYPAALAALREHETRFPHGILASERDVARALVLCESGDLEQGRALAAPFAGTAWSSSLAQACTESGETP
jgi:hypothetical protein